MKKTKIICTIGPACENIDTIKQMVKEGMNIARINFSHGSNENHLKTIELLKKCRQELNVPLGIMLDTKGPEYRIGKFENGEVVLKSGQKFTLTTNNILGNDKIVSVSYSKLNDCLDVGDKVLVNDGLIELKVVSKDKKDIICKVVTGGNLPNNKSMFFPNKVFKRKYLSEQDKQDIILGINAGVDFIACSFVSCADDILSVKKLLKQNNKEDVLLIAKIENQEGVNNLQSILDVCDGVMIGRGDLGVHISQENLPNIQKHIIQTCNKNCKIVITATEMLESMIYNPRPTRAETSDVANAIYDGTTAVMLSGESAVGKYPVLTVKTMSKIIEQAEKYEGLKSYEIINNNCSNLHSVCKACVDIAKQTNSKLIVALSHTGKTIKTVSYFKPNVNILGLITDESKYHKMSIYYGVDTYLIKDSYDLQELYNLCKQKAKDCYSLKTGDNIVITGGTKDMTNTNMIKIEKL